MFQVEDGPTEINSVVTSARKCEGRIKLSSRFNTHPACTPAISNQMDRFQFRKTFRKAMAFDPNAHADLIESLWDDADEMVDQGDRLISKKCVRTTVRLAAEEQQFVVKRHLERSWRHQCKQFFCRSRAQRCWNDTWYLVDNGYPTPRPTAYLEKRLGSLRGCSFYVYRYVEGQTLKELGTGLRNQRMLRRYVLQMVEIWRLHKLLHVNLTDGHPANFIIDATGKMWVIDLDKLQFVHSPRKLNTLLRASFDSALRGVIGDRLVIEFANQKINEALES